MRIEQPIAVIARNMVITMVREIEAVVSLAVAVGNQALCYQHLGNQHLGNQHLGNCLFGNDSLLAMQVTDLHRSWGSHAPARATAMFSVTTQSLPILRHQHKPMLASCLTSSQLPENQRDRADG